MGNLVIGLNASEVKNKILELDALKNDFNNESLVKPLTFGITSHAKQSEGDAVIAVERLNVELDIVAKKLASLVEATNSYLGKVIENFELADNI